MRELHNDTRPNPQMLKVLFMEQKTKENKFANISKEASLLGLKPYFYSEDEHEKFMGIIDEIGLNSLSIADTLYTFVKPFDIKPIKDGLFTHDAYGIMRLDLCDFFLRPNFDNVHSCHSINESSLQHNWAGNLNYIANPYWSCIGIYKAENSHVTFCSDQISYITDCPNLLATANICLCYSPQTKLPGIMVSRVYGNTIDFAEALPKIIAYFSSIGLQTYWYHDITAYYDNSGNFSAMYNSSSDNKVQVFTLPTNALITSDNSSLIERYSDIEPARKPKVKIDNKCTIFESHFAFLFGHDCNGNKLHHVTFGKLLPNKYNILSNEHTKFKDAFSDCSFSKSATEVSQVLAKDMSSMDLDIDDDDDYEYYCCYCGDELYEGDQCYSEITSDTYCRHCYDESFSWSMYGHCEVRRNSSTYVEEAAYIRNKGVYVSPIDNEDGEFIPGDDIVNCSPDYIDTYFHEESMLRAVSIVSVTNNELSIERDVYIIDTDCNARYLSDYTTSTRYVSITSGCIDKAVKSTSTRKPQEVTAAVIAWLSDTFGDNFTMDDSDIVCEEQYRSNIRDILIQVASDAANKCTCEYEEAMLFGIGEVIMK